MVLVDELFPASSRANAETERYVVPKLDGLDTLIVLVKVLLELLLSLLLIKTLRFDELVLLSVAVQEIVTFCDEEELSLKVILDGLAERELTVGAEVSGTS